MFPSWQYSRLPASDPETASAHPTSKKRSSLLYLRHWVPLKPVTFALSFLIFSVLIFHISKKLFPRLFLPRPTFSFDSDPRPAWLDSAPAERPLVLRVAVISAPDEFDKRAAIRDTIFRGVRESDVKLIYRFFVGTSAESMEERVMAENEEHKDVVLLDNIPDVRERISEKRYGALKWGGSVQSDTYDYFMTMDTDTFVRFGSLAKRLPVFLRNHPVQPRKQAVLIARMMPERRYYLNTVPDGNTNSSDHDDVLDGPQYQYPAGIAYMLSSFLVDTLLSTDPPLPHHIHYPFDDVMVGAWIASLKMFHDPQAKFTSFIPNKHWYESGKSVKPKRLLPKPVDTIILDDVEGWHDFLGRGGHDSPFSWNSVCVHHVSPGEMRLFRAMEEISDEWIS